MSKQQITYIALLRGINVGGHTVKMEILRHLFEELKFTQVRSYIQSGNIFFETSEDDVTLLRNKIEHQLKTHLGYEVIVCLRTIKEIENILKLNPFNDIELTPETRFSIVFLADFVKNKLAVPYKTADGAYELVGSTSMELFVVWHLKNGRPGNSYGAIEKKLQVKSTTRFWHTTLKILAAAKQE